MEASGNLAPPLGGRAFVVDVRVTTKD